MIPTKQQTLNLLDEARYTNPRNKWWVIHSLGVGNSAATIAAALNKSQSSNYDWHPLDPEKLTKLGYLHDIGKRGDDWVVHPYEGYRFLQSLGYDEEYCQISLTHSFVNNDAFCMFSEFMQPKRDKFVIDYIADHEFTLEEKIVAICDMMFGTSMWTLDKRIIDIISRHGVCSQTQQRIQEVYKLKAYLDDLLGFNLYDLFPELKDNL